MKRCTSGEEPRGVLLSAPTHLECDRGLDPTHRRSSCAAADWQPLLCTAESHFGRRHSGPKGATASGDELFRCAKMNSAYVLLGCTRLNTEVLFLHSRRLILSMAGRS